MTQLPKIQEGSSPPWSSAEVAKLSPKDEELVKLVTKQALEQTDEFKHFFKGFRPSGTGLADYLFGCLSETRTPAEIFDRLRWGGLYVFTSPQQADVAKIAQSFGSWGGFAIDVGCPSHVLKSRWGLPFFKQKIYYCIARKIQLIPPGATTDRFTYHVQLFKHKNPEHGYVVMKKVPTLERVMMRLRGKFPDLDPGEIERRARKFTDKVFPIFLTREAAILKILQRDLPAEYRDRIPALVDVETDAQGYVRTLYMKWLRNGGRLLTQLEFSKQAADLLRVLHDIVGVMHLDLRLDNFVITEKGVGFIDFGSAVRVGEVLSESPLLNSLFEEMMKTSQIQRMLGKMMDRGMVTSHEISECYGKVDKAVDFFYLAVQINAPHGNPDFKGLVQFDPTSREAVELARLTQKILKPIDPQSSPFRSANDILKGLSGVEQTLRTLDSRDAIVPGPAQTPPVNTDALNQLASAANQSPTTY